MSETAIRHAIETGRLRRDQGGCQRSAALSPGQRAERDAAQARGAGTAVKRIEERLLACQGGLTEAAPHFEPVEGVANAGVLLALPAVIGEGLLRCAERFYTPLKAGFYGLHSILLCLVMMALLRIKNIERLSAHQPGELGLLLGLDRVPEVKTLRRKLEELGGQQRAAKLAAALTERWSQGEPDELGILYIDGHVNTYTGRKHRLPKTFVQKRRQAMPAATDVWVHNGAAEPLFFVTSPINEHLLAVLDREVIPANSKLPTFWMREIRRLCNNGHQTAILTTRQDLPAQEIAALMFARWRQENFFKYMQAEFNIDCP